MSALVGGFQISIGLWEKEFNEMGPWKQQTIPNLTVLVLAFL